ncbi:sugar ABC transporter ATP-binding protein [Streptomyces sp. WI04-05B]|uniref:sugar ABC transporter ATP-binding protein n=1 Tax=Streptomyces TaxID=1883 RepID=UPI0029A0A9A2|nr:MULTISPECIES: sugar ABC transporter ATP-binding protein [unclassified Streptomyces]MDX2546962.1 sugar ABC transporter ATP-binding protein [Streptomyces sp. WI04-05B]MDX2589346.1 sugar ABC transporter ATP-binding protein [Streptomyces sp. WI04-05A]MDX3748130.1 sugar ABC transporter ATP-binding protein [Streptomyces sp. AK08-02]
MTTPQTEQRRDADAPLLAMTGIHKSYGGVTAVRGAGLRITGPGLVHTLMGQNGCGKSTMLGVLSGQIRPDAGTLRLNGTDVRLRSPLEAVRRGIAMVTQETALALDLTVAENILLGRMARTARGVDWAASRRRAASVLAQLGLDYDPRTVVRRLRPDQRQLVEIARALSLEPHLLILDEPTSTLTDDEVERLFAAVDGLRRRQVSVLFVSHRLDEVFRLSDELTVMRDGRTVSAGPAGRYTAATLMADMVGGRDLGAGTLHPADGSREQAAAEPGPAAEPLLSVRGLSSPGAFDGIDLDLRRGKVVGVAGLVGSGRGELLETIFGARPPGSGTMTLAGRPHRPAGPRSAIAAGIGYVPPDRRTQGVALGMAVGDNVTMVATHRHSRLRTVDRRSAASLAKRLSGLMRLSVTLSRRVATLSGGNQQKVVLAKWLGAQPRVLLLDDPTRGVDVAAKAEIHAHLRRLAAQGLALLVTSSEIPELITLCDEIVVLNRGRLAGRFAGEATESLVAAVAAGASS